MSQEYKSTAPLGLIGFATMMIFLCTSLAGVVEADFGPLAFSYSFMIGGTMLLLGGFLEFLKKNIFVGTVFCTFGPFWMGLGLFQLLAASGSIKLSGAFPAGFTTYLAVYGVISILFWLGALRINVALVSTFSTLIVALFLLVGGQYGNMGAQKAGAWFGIITGFQAFYVATAIFLGEMWGKAVLPVGPLDAYWNPPKVVEVAVNGDAKQDV